MTVGTPGVDFTYTVKVNLPTLDTDNPDLDAINQGLADDIAEHLPSVIYYHGAPYGVNTSGVTIG
jgi:hypothetical protein